MDAWQSFKRKREMRKVRLVHVWAALGARGHALPLPHMQLPRMQALTPSHTVVSADEASLWRQGWQGRQARHR